MSAARTRKFREAIMITEKALSAVLPLIRVGARERDIARALLLSVKRLGGEGFSFRPIVASGHRSALPHGRATARSIRKGDTVVVDFGVKLGGLRSDMTRTFVVGAAGRKRERMFGILLRAQAAAVRAVRSGVRACDVDAAARRVISESGYGKAFIHSTGHGIGRKVHEAPKISRRNSNALKAGAVITIEPGIYLKGRGGMRIEDMYLVTSRGCRRLTRFPRRLHPW